MSYQNPAASCKSSAEITLRSTIPWRDRWRDHGTSWQSLIDLHLEIVGMLTACPTCGAAPCINPHFCELCRKADEKQAKKTQPAHNDHSAAVSTVEALMVGLRERGTNALTEPKELSEQQLHEVCSRLQRLKPEIARAWSPNEIILLVDAWNLCHG